MESADVLTGSSADASVRPAAEADLPAIGAIHARAWTTAYAELIPRDVLPEITPHAMTEAWRPHLEVAGEPMHHLLVACSGPTVVAFGAFGPASPQRWLEPGDAELSTLLVDPAHQRRGHGSRLLAAGVDLLREDRVRRLFTWVPAADGPRIAFLESAGFGRDGAWRELTLGSDDAEQGYRGDEPEHGLREVRLVAVLHEDVVEPAEPAAHHCDVEET
ncbi:MAG: N-acetyltransferase family protein [Actinomycetes bacterium]